LNNLPFHLDTWRQKTERSEDWEIYVSPEQWEEEKEANATYKRLRDLFTAYSRDSKVFTLEVLRAMDELLESQ